MNLYDLVLNAPDDLLMMSRKDCHAKNVSSIVVGRSESGGLVRIFLAWTGHELEENHLHGELPVGIHDHRYSLRLKLLAGKVRHTIYCKGSGEILKKFAFRSGQMEQPPTVSFQGIEGLMVSKSEWLTSNDWLKISSETLHNVCCKGMAAWIVEEGTVERNITTLYSPRYEINTNDLYEAFVSAEEVREHVAQFIRLLEAQGPFDTMPEVPFHESPIDYDSITVYDAATQIIPSGARVEVWRVEGSDGVYVVMRRPMPDGSQRVIKFLLTRDAAEALYGLLHATIFTEPQ